MDLEEFLHPREIAKLEKLAVALGEDFSPRFAFGVLKDLVKIVPNSIKPVHRLSQEVLGLIENVEKVDGHIDVHLKDGYVLRTFESRQQYRNYYYCFRTHLPNFLGPESYQACHDVGFRYLSAQNQIKKFLRLGYLNKAESYNFIECGAYVGWKALGYSRFLGKEGKILVLEIDDRQFELAKLNMQRNLDESRFYVMNTGVWNETEENRKYSYEHFASHTLNTPDKHAHHSQYKFTNTDTLDNIIDAADVDTYDFLNIQTGGSELESVQGLERNLNRVKTIYLGTHYLKDGVSLRYLVTDYLLGIGCRVYTDAGEFTNIAQVDKESVGGLVAVTPKYRDVVIPRV